MFVACLAGAGCKHEKSVDDALAEWKPRVEPKLAAIEKIAKQTPGGTLAATLKLTVVDQPNEKPLSGDTVITYPEDLAALVSGAAPPSKSRRHTSSTALVECWYAIKHHELGGFALSDSRYGAFESKPLAHGFQPKLLCEQLDQAKYLAVVREGKVTGSGSEVPDDPSKAAGSFQSMQGGGVIDLYELPSGREIGRRPYLAKGASSIVYKTKDKGVASTIAADDAIGRDFDEKVWAAIEESLAGIRPRPPG